MRGRIGDWNTKFKHPHVYFADDTAPVTLKRLIVSKEGFIIFPYGIRQKILAELSYYSFLAQNNAVN